MVWWSDRALGFVRLAAEAVHAQRPLQADHSALDRLDGNKRCDHAERRPDRQMDPVRCREDQVGHHEAAEQNVAQHHDHQIGRQVVGPVVEDFLTAGRTGVDRLQIGAKELAAATGRTLVEQAAHDGSAEGPFRFRVSAEAHGFVLLAGGHVFSFHVFPHRLGRLGRVPGFLNAPRRPALWNERVAVGMGRPSLSISKRRAPASGIASTSFTSTESPSR